MSGPPVIIASNGRGFPVKAVQANAPVLTLSANGLGAPIVITERGAPFILEGSGPPPPVPGPLDVVVSENNGFTNFSQEFDLATDSVILGLACAFTGNPVITIAHGGEPLTIVNRIESGETSGKRWLSLLAVGKGLTIGVDELTVTATGGQLHGGALRINEMATIGTPETGWTGSQTGGGQPIAPVNVGTTSGGVIKGVFVNSTADRQHGDRVTGATDLFNGYTTTGDPVAVDMSTAGAWVLGAGWSIDGDDFVHTGPSSILSISYPATAALPSFRCLADIGAGGTVVVNATSLETYNGPSIWPIATYANPPSNNTSIRAVGDVRISRMSLVDNAVPVAWMFFTEPAVTGQSIRFSTIYTTTQWAWVATEVRGTDY